MSTPQITIVEETAHPEKEATVQVKVDPDLTEGQDNKNIETIVSIGAIDHAHMIKKTTQKNRNRQNSPYKKRNNYKQRSRSNSFARSNNYNRNSFSTRGNVKCKSRSNSRNNTFHPKAYDINIAEFKNGIQDNF